MVNKSFLTRKISKVNKVPLRDASSCIDVLIDSIAEELSKGNRIELRGLGTFYIKKIAAKRSYFADRDIPEHNRVLFRPSQKLKQTVRNIDC